MIESPVISVHIPLPLRAYAKGAEEVTVSGDNVAEALEALGHEYPELSGHLMDGDGHLKPYMHLYLRGINILNLDGLDTTLSNEDVLTIISMNIEEMAAAYDSRAVAEAKRPAI